jgi:rod shape-determining protein MreC
LPGILPPAERRSVVLVMVYTGLSLLLLVVGDHLPVSWLRGAGAFAFAPFDRMVLTGDRLFAAWRENTTLHQRIAHLEVENAQLRVEGSENRRLRGQLDLPAWRGLVLTPVEVLALAGDPIPTAATLSAGTLDGIHVGDALLTRDGLVGRVTEAWGRLSRASLLTDPNLAVACEIETTGVNGILRVSLSPRLRLLLSAVPLADTMRVGERIVTSNLSLRFPRGIPVGRVRSIQADASGLMQEVEVEPSAQLSRLRQAFVAPGPVPPDGSRLPHPHIEFEPRRIAESPPVRGKPAVQPARRDSVPAGAAGGAR